MKIAALVLVLFVAACGPSTGAGNTGGTTIAVIDDIEAGMPLDSMLALLESRLAIALEGRLDAPAVEEFRVAEAITDRLLEARLPFEWISSEDYSVEARLRQIQSGADRVLAQVQMSLPRDTVVRELQLLHDEVVGLRRSIAEGGRRAPPTIQALLGDSARYVGVDAPRPSEDTARTAPARRSGPLGTPVPPPDAS